MEAEPKKAELTTNKEQEQETAAQGSDEQRQCTAVAQLRHPAGEGYARASETQ